MEIIEVDEFEKDLRKIKVDLEHDIENYKALILEYCPNFTGQVVGAKECNNLGEDHHPAYKSKKFRCKALKEGSRSSVRVIYIYNKEEEKIYFIEIYLKNHKDNYDLERLRRYSKK